MPLLQKNLNALKNKEVPLALIFGTWPSSGPLRKNNGLKTNDFTEN
jgi:hypothetical protein